MGLISDVDGTISRIAERPEEATLEPRVLAALGDLARTLDVVAALSGRSITQLRSMVPVAGLTYVGSHGLEWWYRGRATIAPPARPFLHSMHATIESLRANLDLPGVLVENKGITCSIHYRLSPSPLEARDAILNALSDSEAASGLRIVQGRMVVDLLPPVGLNKGTAVRHLVRAHALRAVIYLGDDATDLDAFRALHSLRSTGQMQALLLAVESREAPEELLSVADCVLDSVETAEAFLDRLAREATQDPHVREDRGGL